MIDPQIGQLLDMMYEQVDTITTEEGDVYISIHTVDLMNSVIQNSVMKAMDDGADVSEDCLFGIAWVASLYQMLHDTMELKGNTEPVPDTPASLTEE